MHRIRVRLFVLSALAFLAVACGSINNKIVVRDNGKTVVEKPQLLDRYPNLALMDDVALLSAAVYDDPKTPTTTSVAEYCAAGDTLALDPAAEMGWQEQTDLPGLPEPPAGIRRVPDLRYRVWTKKSGGRTYAVLAFRGTQSRADWFSNLRWITMFVPRTWDHYEQLLRIVPDLVAAIRARNGEDTIIIPTGHSLGGGLAQLAGYSSDGAVKTVMAFDPSTVTHYYGVDRALRERSKQEQDIFRIFEQGEVLSYLRWFLKRVYPISHENPRIVQVKYHLLGGGVIRNHSIRRFACAARTAPATAVAHATSR